MASEAQVNYKTREIDWDVIPRNNLQNDWMDANDKTSFSQHNRLHYLMSMEFILADIYLNQPAKLFKTSGNKFLSL